MHKAKERAQTLLQMKQEAQIEAKQQEAKHKYHKKHSQPLPLMQITTTFSQSPICSQIWVDVGSLGFLETSLIGTSVDTSIISYDLWEELGKPFLRTTTLQVMGFSR